MKQIKGAICLLSSLLIMGCQSVLDAPTDLAPVSQTISHQDSRWTAHLAQLTRIQAYDTQGQIGFISPKERFSSQFDWQYLSANQYQFTLSSIFSNQRLTFTRHQNGVTLSDEQGRTRTEAQAEPLLNELIGVSFPVDQLGEWLKGVPPKNADYQLNEQGRLAQFSYALADGVWQVKYMEYDEALQPAMPSLLVLTNGTQTLKIRLDKWAIK